MSIRLQIRQAMRAGRDRLPDPAAAEAFLQSQYRGDGAFHGRDARGDLYYTVFGLEAADALGLALPPEPTAAFLRSFGQGESLDLVHLCCLLRCWAGLPADVRDADRIGGALLTLEQFRTADGGYGEKGGPGSAYGCFLALAAWQDHAAGPPAPQGIFNCLQLLRTADGGYANQSILKMATLPTTAAAAVILGELGYPVDQSLAWWLFSCLCEEGGFAAFPGGSADLLSTATALLALRRMNRDLGRCRETCLRYVQSLWRPEGGFLPARGETALDCEYLWYGLLALGCLAE